MSKIGFSSLARLGLAALGIGTALFLLFRVNDLKEGAFMIIFTSSGHITLIDWKIDGFKN